MITRMLKKLKEQKKCVLKRTLKFNDYKNCLFKTILKSQQRFYKWSTLHIFWRNQ